MDILRINRCRPRRFLLLDFSSSSNRRRTRPRILRRNSTILCHRLRYRRRRLERRLRSSSNRRRSFSIRIRSNSRLWCNNNNIINNNNNIRLRLRRLLIINRTSNSKCQERPPQRFVGANGIVPGARGLVQRRRGLRHRRLVPWRRAIFRE